jgi:hypothetical protein
MWFFILMIEGKPPEAFASDSEAFCKEAMAKLLMLQRVQGKKATGACYVRASAVDDTDKPLTGTSQSR